MAVEFGVQRVYLKDLSFESPRSPDVFKTQWQPKIQLDINTRTATIGDDNYEVVLTVTLHAKEDDETTTSMIVEVQQAGIFQIKGLEEPELKRTLATHCPNLLFPYVRETIDSMVVRGSFPPMNLAPVNFEALYAEAARRQTEGDDGVTH
jgi:preprotein translocase subunit SecB